MAISFTCRLMSFNLFHQRGSALFQFIQHLGTSNHCYNDSTINNHDPLDPKIVLNTKNRANCIERLKKISLAKTFDKNSDTKNAAVLVPLCLHNNELGLLYTLRSKTLSTNGGQVSFPGGIKDDADQDYKATAVRETWEELRIPQEKVDIWAQGNFVGRKEVNVMPILGYIGEINPKELHINHQEVEEAFVLSLRHLCNPQHCKYTQFRGGYTLPTFTGGEHQVWGLTAIITHMIMRALAPDVYKHKLRFLKSIGQFSQQEKVNKLFT